MLCQIHLLALYSASRLAALRSDLKNSRAGSLWHKMCWGTGRSKDEGEIFGVVSRDVYFQGGSKEKNPKSWCTGTFIQGRFQFLTNRESTRQGLQYFNQWGCSGGGEQCRQTNEDSRNRGFPGDFPELGAGRRQDWQFGRRRDREHWVSRGKMGN